MAARTEIGAEGNQRIELTVGICVVDIDYAGTHVAMGLPELIATLAGQVTH